MASAAAWLLLALAARAGGGRPLVEPPPGWRDATAELARPGVVCALKGPGSAAFLLAEARGAPTDNPAAARLYLLDALRGVRAGSRADYRAQGSLRFARFRGGATAQILAARRPGGAPLVLALIEAGGGRYLATLRSAAPEAMLPALLEGFAGAAAGGALSSGEAVSSDGQLALSLGGGLAARLPASEEAARGAVLVVLSGGSRLVFSRRSGALPRAASAGGLLGEAEEPPGGGREEGERLAEAATPAGPSAIYAWTPRGVPGEEERAAGLLPWGYGSYAFEARGPGARDLAEGALAALRAGPRAEPKLLAATPRLARGGESGATGAGARAAAAAAVLAGAAVAAALWSRRRKSARFAA